MSFPSDVSLSANAKYFGLIDPKYSYNLNWDVVWSFSYALSGIQHGFCTFLTTNPSLTGSCPGHYMGYHGLSGVLGIAFDSTGYFALSTPIRSGLPLSSIKSNALIIRDSSNEVIYNESLSSLDTSFVMASSVKTYQALRFRYCNSGRKLYIDFDNFDDYKNLLTLDIDSLNINDNTVVYPGITFCSPISSLDISPSTMFIKNFHTQGNLNSPNYENSTMTPLTGVISNTFTTLSGISANPI